VDIEDDQRSSTLKIFFQYNAIKFPLSAIIGLCGRKKKETDTRTLLHFLLGQLLPTKVDKITSL
jgi:hypothetical protein